MRVPDFFRRSKKPDKEKQKSTDEAPVESGKQAEQIPQTGMSRRKATRIIGMAAAQTVAPPMVKAPVALPMPEIAQGVSRASALLSHHIDTIAWLFKRRRQLQGDSQSIAKGFQEIDFVQENPNEQVWRVEGVLVVLNNLDARTKLADLTSDAVIGDAARIVNESNEADNVHRFDTVQSRLPSIIESLRHVAGLGEESTVADLKRKLKEMFTQVVWNAVRNPRISEVPALERSWLYGDFLGILKKTVDPALKAELDRKIKDLKVEREMEQRMQAYEEEVTTQRSEGERDKDEGSKLGAQERLAIDLQNRELIACRAESAEREPRDAVGAKVFLRNRLKSLIPWRDAHIPQRHQSHAV